MPAPQTSPQSAQPSNGETDFARLLEGKHKLARHIDSIAAQAMSYFEQAGAFEAEIAIAAAIQELREALTADMMKPIMALMNTDLGFRTDKDPNQRDKDGRPFIPYSVEVVRDCVIEAKLRGFHTVGNEFNIIAGRFYAARNGLKRKCEKFPGVTNLKLDLGVPRIVGDKGAIIQVEARWEKDGVADSIKAEIPIRVNAFMGTDAIIGKAERKIYKRVSDRLTGISTPDGEIDDVPTAASVASESTEVKFGKAAEKTTLPAQPAMTGGYNSASESDSPKASEPKAKTIQQDLGEFLTNAGVTFDDFRDWATQRELLKDPQSVGSFDEVPTEVCQLLRNDLKTLNKCITIYGKRAETKPA